MRVSKRTLTVFSLVMVMVLTASLVASGASTTKALSTNFTLVNLSSGSNAVNISYIKSDGTAWGSQPTEVATLANQGDQLIRRQYDDTNLTAGSGSVVVGAQGALGAVVQIQTRSGTATRAAYSGATTGAGAANAPYVAKGLQSASGLVNSQIIVQNTGTAATNVTIDLISSATGASVGTIPVSNLAAGASQTVDLADNATAPAGFFGSAVVTAASGGQVAVVANVFSGADTLQTYNAFTNVGQEWLAPLFTSRLANSLSTPIAVQNLSGSDMAAGAIQVVCTKDATSPGQASFTLSNTAAVKNNATYFFNPVTDTNIPAEWYGSCRITTAGNSVAFVQMRVVSGAQAGAYEAIKADGTKTKVVVPLYAKRLANGFASVVTIQNLSKTATANVSLQYVGAAGLPANCSGVVTAQIPANGSLQQNHRLESGGQAVPQIGNACFGTIVVSSDQPIDGIVQLTDISGLAGDTFQVHNAFAID